MFDSRKLLDELMGAGTASPQLASDGQPGDRQGAAGKSVAEGGFASVIGAVLGQAASGLKDGPRGRGAHRHCKQGQ
jgi:hypothetical protein